MKDLEHLIPRLPFSVKLGGLFFTVLYVAVFFSVIYWKIFNRKYIDAFYDSVMIQTFGGNQIEPRTNTEKAVTATQSFIAFMILNGMLVISISHANH
jgi:hypothetical protein